MERDEIFQDDPSNRSPLALDQEVLLNDQFRVGRVLGVGGFGITYLAFDEVLEMVVAVKEYLPNNIAVRKTGSHSVQPLSSSGKKKDFEFGLKRFLQEARTLAKFEAHPNIVRVRTFFEENGTGYLVMNFYEGRTLAEYLASRNGFLPEEEALLIMEQVVDGLGAVHGENILHRDIDPNNVYLADNGTVVLLDFGAARTAVGERTRSISVVLKRGYAPYEQYYSHGDQGAWTDVYACSATLYRTVTGYKPPEAAARILEDDLAPPNELVPSLSDATNEAILQGLEVRPDDRPQSMEEFASMLSDLPDDAEPGWIGEMTAVETGADTDGAAELQLTTSHRCRLYLDGQKIAEFSPGETYTLGVDAGNYRLRAVRIDQAESGKATVTASGTGDDPAPEGSGQMSLDALMWQDIVSVSSKEPTVVEIDFKEKESGITGTEAAPGGAEDDTEPAPEGSNGATVAAALPNEEAEATTTEAPPAILRVETDRGGTLLVDGEERGTIDPGEPLELDVEPGRHELHVEADDGTEVWHEEVELRAGGTRSVEVALDSEEEAEESGEERKILTGFTVGAGVAVGTILVLFGWVLLGHRMFGSEPDTHGSWGENVVERGGAVVETSRTVARRGWVVAGHGLSSVYGTTNDALAWMGVVNKKPRPEPDRVVTTSDILVDVISNDRDPEGESMRLVSAGPIPDSVGTVTVVNSSNLSLKPAAGFAGTIDVPYVVADAPGDTAQSYVDFRVPFDTKHRTVASNIEHPQEVDTDSLGSDGDLDLVIASLGEESLKWSENSLRDDGAFQEPKAIGTSLDGVVDLHTADLNSNGRQDVLAASLRSNAVVWYANQGDKGFSDPRYIAEEAEGAVSVQAADFDGDGDSDVVAGALMDETVTWYENQGDGQFGDGTVIADSVSGLETLHVADLDGDGVKGVLVVSYQDSTISRYEPERDSAEGLMFAEKPPVGTRLHEPIEVQTADILGNGRNDVLAGTVGAESLLLFENRARGDGEITFGNKRIIATDLRTIESIETGDLDGDGDEDIVAGSFENDCLVWFKNRGDGSFGSGQVIGADIPNVISLAVVDVDQDDDVDILAASQAENAIRWYENHLDGEH